MNHQNPVTHGHSSTGTLSTGDLEQVYDALATAIDQAGADRAELFLVKLVLLNANALGMPGVFQTHIDAALKDL